MGQTLHHLPGKSRKRSVVASRFHNYRNYILLLMNSPKRVTLCPGQALGKRTLDLAGGWRASLCLPDSRGTHHIAGKLNRQR